RQEDREPPMPEWKGSFPKAAPSRFPVVSEGERLVRKKASAAASSSWLFSWRLSSWQPSSPWASPSWRPSLPISWRRVSQRDAAPKRLPLPAPPLRLSVPLLPSRRFRWRPRPTLPPPAVTARCRLQSYPSRNPFDPPLGESSPVSRSGTCTGYDRKAALSLRVGIVFANACQASCNGWHALSGGKRSLGKNLCGRPSS